MRIEKHNAHRPRRWTDPERGEQIRLQIQHGAGFWNRMEWRLNGSVVQLTPTARKGGSDTRGHAEEEEGEGEYPRVDPPPGEWARNKQCLLQSA